VQLGATARPIEWCPFDKNAPLFGAYQLETDIEKTLLTAGSFFRSDPLTLVIDTVATSPVALR